MRSGWVFNIQKYSVQDGPGIRTTVFLKGCPLCCSWCHNPEGISSKREVIVVETRCLACGECRQACPFPTAELTGALETSRADCALCEACVQACPTGARQIVGRSMTVAEVMAEILKDRIFYEESGGGVTFSGGEPLAQAEYLKDLLVTCRGRGIHTAVDTCGFSAKTRLREVAELADLLLYDLKLMEDRRHRQYCGVSNVSILENLRMLGQSHCPIWLRVPVIPGVNDDAENLTELAEFARGLPAIRQVNVLPYHPTGAPKHRRLGQVYAHANLVAPTPERMEEIAAFLQNRGLRVKIGGG